MQITRETDYAIRCILYMSETPKRVTAVEEIAAAKNIPKSFLAKILQKLSKADIVTSHAGIKGGFRLARDPKDVNLLTLVEVIQGPLALNACVIVEGACNFRNLCSVHWAWVEIQEKLGDLLQEYDFERLLSTQKTMERRKFYGKRAGV